MVAVRVADLIAANQLVVEVHALVDAVGQVPPVVGDAAALRAAQALALGGAEAVVGVAGERGAGALLGGVTAMTHPQKSSAPAV